jgi:SIR2-like domain
MANEREGYERRPMGLSTEFTESLPTMRRVAEFRETLGQHLKSFRAASFLFVGAGLSRRYLELDGWEALLRRLAELTNEDFDYYSATADGSFPQIAHLIAEELRERWWKEPHFTAHRERFKGQLHHRDSALKAEASIYLMESMARLPAKGPLAKELAALRRVVIDGVITTNFDPLLEHLFPDFRVFVGQEHLLFNDALGIAEIYKIHGSHEDPDSLVLTTADYERFRERNAYLAAKLMTIFVEHPVVFLGYSISDSNVAAILHAIVECLDTTESIKRLADRLIFVQWNKDATEATIAPGVIQVDAKPIPVMSVEVSDFLDLFEVVGSLQRGFPAKLLRQLKEQVYELVLEDQPKGRLHVLPLNSDTDISDIQVVFGVGAIAQLRSYAGLQREEIVDDIVDEGTDLNAVRVVQEALPSS